MENTYNCDYYEDFFRKETEKMANEMYFRLFMSEIEAKVSSFLMEAL